MTDEAVLALLTEIHDYAQLGVQQGKADEANPDPYESGRGQGHKDEARTILALLREQPAIWRAIERRSSFGGHDIQSRPRRALYAGYEDALTRVRAILTPEQREAVMGDLHTLAQALLIVGRADRVERARNAREQEAMRRGE